MISYPPDDAPKAAEVQAASADDVDAAEVQSTPPEDVFFLEWARETHKRNVTVANEVLRLHVTLCAGLLGGAIAFFGKVMAGWFQGGVAFCFLCSLMLALFGAYPYEGTVRADDAARIRRHKERAYKYKLDLLRWSFIALAVGFVIAVVGLFLQHWFPPTTAH